MTNPRGNPEFGKKYKASYGRDQALSAQVKTLLLPQTREQLMILAEKKSCTISDILREAVDQYLATVQAI